jgi:hypothetical protein
MAWKHANEFIDTSAFLPRCYPRELIEFVNSTGEGEGVAWDEFPVAGVGAVCEKCKDGFMWGRGLEGECVSRFHWGKRDKDSSIWVGRRGK